MDVSRVDFEEAAVEMLATLSLNGECVLEMLVVDGGYLVYQESADAPEPLLDEEPLLLANAVEAAPLVDYLARRDSPLGQDPVYLVGEKVGEEEYRIRWAR